MPFIHVVVDGSNIATEGRSIPSLAQLDEAVREFQAEFPQAEITVVVDATFGHRIDSSERPAFDEAQAHGELVSPPAGAIGRGDAFLLRIADRAGAAVLSNDSFQEFHGEYEWLFTKDRLIGGKPVPGVGWIFTPRTPVRGPKSRESIREARRGRVRIGSKEASRPMPVPKAPPPRPGSGAVRPRAGLSDAIAAATAEVVSPEAPASGRRRRRRGGGPPPEAVNDPLTFISFIAEHPLGSEVEGEVDGFASHGSFVVADGARCYLPLSAMGDPAPRSGREVLEKGERRTFVLQALDPQRRGIELALPGFAKVSGTPQQETVDAEIASTHPEPPARAAAKAPARKRSKTVEATPETEPPRHRQEEAPALKTRGRKPTSPEPSPGWEYEGDQPGRAGAKKAGPQKAPAKKPASKKKAAAQTPTGETPGAEAQETAVMSIPAADEIPARKAPVAAAAAKKAPGKKAPGKKAAPKNGAAVKAVTAESAIEAASAEAAPGVRDPVRRAAGKGAVRAGVAPAEKAPAKKAPAKKAPAKKAPAKKAPAKKTPAKKAPAKKAPAKKAPAEKAPAKKAPAEKAPAEKAPAEKAPAKKAPAKKTPAPREGGRPGTPAGAVAPAGEEEPDRPAGLRRPSRRGAVDGVAPDLG